MTKKFVLIITLGLNAIYALGQSVYMHEAQQDAEESGATGISGIFTLIVFFGIVYVISALWSSKKDKKSSSSQIQDGFDEGLYWEEKEQERAELKMMESQIEEELDIPIAFNNADLSPIHITENEFKQQKKEHEDFVNSFVKEQEEKFFPIGSIEDALKNVSSNPIVDLGLSVKWRNKNIGATDIFDIGYKFRWGTFDYIENYDREKLAEYYAIPFDDAIGSCEEDISGNEIFDAATKFSKGELRTPTKKECEELIDRCKWEYVEVDKYKGFIVTGPSGASIYLPLSFSSFVNCMYIVMMSVDEAYMTSTPVIKQKSQTDEMLDIEGWSYRMSIVNNNHKTESFTKRIDSFSKKHRFSPIRGVCQ